MHILIPQVVEEGYGALCLLVEVPLQVHEDHNCFKAVPAVIILCLLRHLVNEELYQTEVLPLCAVSEIKDQ